MKRFASRVEKKVQQYKSVFQDRGIAGLTKAIGEELDEWKNERINIAVTGQAGSGKSTFINALRGLYADQDGAAPVGSETTTTTPRPYAHPNNAKCIMWDLPGIGTDSFPLDTYLKTINPAEFDFFVIVSCSRFTENDIFLAHAIEATGKHFYFVQTKFSDALHNESLKRKGKRPDENKLKEIVVSECQKNLAEFKSFNNIFVIDSYTKDRFDFHYLAKRLVHDLEKISEKKQVALTLTLSAMTREAIEEKKIILEKRISGIALKTAVAPRLFGSDTKVLMEEKEFYRKQFGLDKEAIARDAEASSIGPQLKDIISNLRLKEKCSIANTEQNNAIEKCIPFLTCAFNIYKTYTAGKVWLKQTLDYLAESAIDINSRMVEEVAGNDVTYASNSNSAGL
ncbi:interferon-inducible GTPase 1-like [Mercenaria mercenaria]|uniref:interferon-inducible GTPase 1-like n=1 Tax=Mercenaria mercenaria TaxID=6596 RepID=UPI00234E4628|nr:interferon-inducible GTPase 1-like [Mercenaria mercenaria]